jgi:hypothetical protein
MTSEIFVWRISKRVTGCGNADGLSNSSGLNGKELAYCATSPAPTVTIL